MLLNSSFTKKTIIRPDVIANEKGLDVGDVFTALEEYKDKGLLHKQYKLHCSNCQEYDTKFYNEIHEVPFEKKCKKCKEDLNNLDYVLVFYKVLEDFAI